MSMLSPSSVEKQHQSTGKNTVEISDVELQKKMTEIDKVQAQFKQEKMKQKNKQELEAEILKQKLLGLDVLDIPKGINNIDLKVFKNSLPKILSTHFIHDGNTIKFQNNWQEFDIFWDFCINLRKTEKNDIAFLQKLALGIQKIPVNGFGISFDTADELWWLNCSGSASLFQSLVEEFCSNEVKSYLTTPYWHACNIVEYDNKTYFFDSRNGNFSDISSNVSSEMISEKIKIWRLRTPIPWISRTTFPAYTDSRYARMSNYVWNLISAHELADWTLSKDDILNNIPIEEKEKIKKEALWLLNKWITLSKNELDEFTSFFNEIKKIEETDLWYKKDREMFSKGVSISFTNREYEIIKKHLQDNREEILQFMINKDINGYNFWEENITKKIMEYKEKLHNFRDIMWMNDKQRYDYINTVLNNKSG